MKSITRAGLIVLALVFLAGSAYAALEARLEVEPRLLRLGESARCTLTVTGVGDPPQPNFPDLKGIQIRSLGQSTSINVVNFKYTKSAQFSYSLTPQRTGDFTIGPYKYKAGGEETDIAAVELKVIAPARDGEQSERSQQTLSDMIFARIEIPQEKIYNQQSFNLVLKIFAREGLNLTGNFQPYGFPDSRLNLGEFASLGQERIEIDGQLYTRYQFSAPARAISSGEYNVEPGLRAGLRVDRRDRRANSPFGDSFFDSFFDRARVERVDVPVQPLTLNVLPLPSDGRPESFNGAVGDISFNVQVKPTELEAGNPVTVTMVVEGRGNIDNITPPDLDLGPDFKSYEPNLISDDTNGGYSGARKVFEQVVIPRSEEVDQLPAIGFSYFDPGQGQYKTVRRGPFPLQVSPSSSKSFEISAADAEPQSASEPDILGTDIVYLKNAPAREYSLEILAPLREVRFWAFNAVPVLLLGALYGWQRRRSFLMGNVAAARRQKAPKAARAAMARAQDALRNAERQDFFEAVWCAATDYFGHRLNLAPGEVGSGQILDYVRRAGLEQSALDRLEAILKRCELERFGAAAGEGGDWCEDARKIQTEMRDLLKRCERLRIKSGAVNLPLLFGLGLLIAVGSTFLCRAESGERHSPARGFARAAEAYDAGKLDLALEEYGQLLEQGATSPQLFYNVGNTHFRKREFGKAVLFYRKAWYLAPRDPDISANLDLALAETGALTTSLPPLAAIFTSLSGREWLWLSLGAYWLLVALIMAAVLIARYRSLIMRAAIPVALLLALAVGGVLCWGKIVRGDESVVVGKAREALFAPIKDSTAHFTLPVGSIVDIVDRANGWAQVEVDDTRGWVPASSVEHVLGNNTKQ